jgi:ubiquinone/menaquinone biosynthesis C-methylase UbiE
MFEKILKKIYTDYNKKTSQNEDRVILRFINNLNAKNNIINYLEVGSGVGRFPEIVKQKFSNLSIKCLEINNNLVSITREKGLDTIQGNILNSPFQNEEFDITHCSHVIEHLGYPDIVHVLDEIFRITKKGGYVIIRSPLMYPGFYFDIDHVRPYPPESILNYFNNEQQQKMGSCKITEIARWYRKIPIIFYNTDSFILRAVNLLSRSLWTIIGLPRSKPTGYILILKKCKVTI